MKCVVGSVIYKEAVNYIDSFLQCLLKQNDDDFQIILINDNFNKMEIEKKLERYFYQFGERLNLIHMNEQKLKPYQLRVELLLEAKKRGANLLILADCDDCFSENRVLAVKSSFEEEFVFFYNEIRDFSYCNVMPELPERIDAFKTIAEMNCLGLSNTALNLTRLSVSFINSLYGGETLIFDWYLFSRILLEVGKGKKVNDCFTYYRIHETNIAGRTSVTLDNIKKEIEVKICHYKLMQNHHDYYKELLDKYIGVDYTSYVQNNCKEPMYWWGLITELEE